MLCKQIEEGLAQQAGEDMTLHQFLKALHDDRCKRHWVAVIEGVDVGFFWQQYNGGGLKAGWDNGLRQRLVKNQPVDPYSLSVLVPSPSQLPQHSLGSPSSSPASPHTPLP